MQAEHDDYCSSDSAQQGNVLPHQLAYSAGHRSQGKEHGAESENEEHRIQHDRPC